MGHHDHPTTCHLALRRGLPSSPAQACLALVHAQDCRPLQSSESPGSNEIMHTSIVESILPHPLLTSYWFLSGGPPPIKNHYDGRQSSWVLRKSRKAPASSMLRILCVVAEYAPIYLQRAQLAFTHYFRYLGMVFMKHHNMTVAA